MLIIAILIGIALYFGILYLIRCLRPGVQLSQRTKYVIGVIVGISIIGSDEIRYYYGPKAIGSFLERGEPYTTSYYVNLYPQENGVGNYKVKSDITTVDTSGSGDNHRIYYPDKIYLPDNQSLTFYNNRESFAIANGEGLVVGKKEHFIDDAGRSWWIELTTQQGN